MTTRDEATEQERWQAKVAAWLHDPAEKALVLLRDPAGHEGGTVRALQERLFPGGTVPEALAGIVRRADRWAAAADRPQFPRDPQEHRYAPWTQVRFADRPVLIHPLAGNEYDLKTLGEIAYEAVKAVSLDHFERLLERTAEGGVDWRRTFLSLWRLGPETPAGQLGALWAHLPADTRVPDHSIWEHLGLVSALAGAMARGGSPALVAFHIGPVQSFIAQARTTSDLWAGSHLLARMTWEAMRVVCARYGPDAVLFPDLRGVPLVDLWLYRDEGIELAEHLKGPRSDSHPLFSATLPNRFLALVPEAEVEALTDEVRCAARAWVRERALDAWKRLLERTERGEAGEYGCGQIERQTEGFPEVSWAAVPWTLVEADAATGVIRNTDRLAAALAVFVGEGDPAGGPGFLGSTAWKLLSRQLTAEGAHFYEPNPGALYGALYDLLDRAAAAARTVRPFPQHAHHGYRCSLCGEREWLTHDPALLERARQAASRDSVWGRAAQRCRAWVRGGPDSAEHLCAICLLKRLWPVLFVDEVKDAVSELEGLQRYVVSTHTMALASTLAEIVRGPDRAVGAGAFKRLEAALAEDGDSGVHVALPRRLALGLGKGVPEALRSVVRQLPVRLDDLRDEARAKDREAERRQRAIQEALADVLKAVRQDDRRWRPEAYYALLLMDGDRMGAWLSATGDCARLQYRALWHPVVRQQAEAIATGSPDLDEYLRTSPPPSPAYHAAISRALNGFSGQVARAVVEDLALGKVIYAGGDDVLAMVSVDDLLRVMLALRCAYSGVLPGNDQKAFDELVSPGGAGPLRIGGGYVQLRRKDFDLFRMMGERATASVGAVVAHHMAPLGSVLRELRRAEARAKREGGRDAFSIALIKRSGSATHFTAGWNVATDGVPAHRTPVGVMHRLRGALRDRLSRRAAYNILAWLGQLPAAPTVGTMSLDPEAYRALLAENLAWQMNRNRQRRVAGGGDGDDAAAAELRALADALADVALYEAGRREKAQAPEVLAGLITVAEFLARAERGGE